MLTVSEVDPTDERALKAYWKVESAAHLSGRPHGLSRSWQALQNTALPTDYFAHHLLSAVEDGHVLGVADLGCGLQDNPHLATINIAVAPEHRRRGVGRALQQHSVELAGRLGRTTLIGEAHATAADQGAVAFGEALGFETVHTEDHLWCALPMAAKLRARADAQVAERSDAYELITWVDHCPEEYVEDYCRLHSQMDQDVPMGEIDWEPVVYDAARLRAFEVQRARAYTQVVCAARRQTDGVFGGYSVVVLDPTQDYAYQDDTLVMPEHRGHRLGLRMKLANLDIMQREHPERTSIHTWTAVENAPMQHTNRTFGFIPVERSHEMQLMLK